MLKRAAVLLLLSTTVFTPATSDAGIFRCWRRRCAPKVCKPVCRPCPCPVATPVQPPLPRPTPTPAKSFSNRYCLYEIYMEHEEYCTWLADPCNGQSGMVDAPCNMSRGYCDNPNDPNCIEFNGFLSLAQTSSTSNHVVHPKLAGGLRRPPRWSRPRPGVVKDFDDSVVVWFRKANEADKDPKHYAKLIFFRGRTSRSPRDEPTWEERRIGYEVLTPSDEEAKATRIADHVYDLQYRGETYRIITLADPVAN